MLILTIIASFMLGVCFGVFIIIWWVFRGQEGQEESYDSGKPGLCVVTTVNHEDWIKKINKSDRERKKRVMYRGFGG